MDRLAIATPFHVPYGSPILPGLVSMTQQIVEAPTPQPYNAFMEGLQAEVLTWGLESAILGPAVFSPLPYWLGPKVVQEPGAVFSDRLEAQWPDVLQVSIGVNAVLGFQS